jgi:Leucine-rich repeat (LRR) protein
LQANEISSLPDGLFLPMSHLQSLSLGMNRLTSLSDGIFQGLPELESLDLGSAEKSGQSIMNASTYVFSAPGFSSKAIVEFSGVMFTPTVRQAILEELGDRAKHL